MPAIPPTDSTGGFPTSRGRKSPPHGSSFPSVAPSTAIYPTFSSSGGGVDRMCRVLGLDTAGMAARTQESAAMRRVSRATQPREIGSRACGLAARMPDSSRLSRFGSSVCPCCARYPSRVNAVDTADGRSRSFSVSDWFYRGGFLESENPAYRFTRLFSRLRTFLDRLAVASNNSEFVLTRLT
jgi:hypothetical protein